MDPLDGSVRLALRQRTWLSIVLAFLAVLALLPMQARYTQAQELPEVQPLAEWSDSKRVKFRDRPIRVHLLTGYAREVRLPEPVTLLDQTAILPACEIVIQADRLALYPAGRFYRTPLTLLGTRTDTLYQLVISSSPNGQRKPIEIRR